VNLAATKKDLAALSRTDLPDERNDFFVYLDEFQSFTTLSLANMLSELRKCGKLLGLGVPGERTMVELDRVDGVERIQELFQALRVHMPAELGGPRPDIREVDVHIRPPVKHARKLFDAMRVSFRQFFDSRCLGFEHMDGFGEYLRYPGQVNAG
jgi:hypothetical protein